MIKKTLQLNWENWNSGFVKLGVRWAERDIKGRKLHFDRNCEDIFRVDGRAYWYWSFVCKGNNS